MVWSHHMFRSDGSTFLSALDRPPVRLRSGWMGGLLSFVGMLGAACTPAPPSLTVQFAAQAPSAQVDAVEAWQFYLTWVSAEGILTRSEPIVVRPGSSDASQA